MSKEIDSWRDLIQQNGSNKPKQTKLSIPKKIAEMLDELEFDWDMMVFHNISEGDYQELFDYIDRGNSPVIMTYLASKALGVELVGVIE